MFQRPTIQQQRQDCGRLPEVGSREVHDPVGSVDDRDAERDERREQPVDGAAQDHAPRDVGPGELHPDDHRGQRQYGQSATLARSVTASGRSSTAGPGAQPVVSGIVTLLNVRSVRAPRKKRAASEALVALDVVNQRGLRENRASRRFADHYRRRNAPPGRCAGRAPAVRAGLPRGDAPAHRARVADEDVLAANEADAEAVKWQLQRRLDSLNDDAGSLCFGRIDDEADERWYIGRRHVKTDPACPWCRLARRGGHALLPGDAGRSARPAPPPALRVHGPELSDVFEEDFDDPDSLAGSGGVPTRSSPSWAGPAPDRCATSSPRSRASRTRSSARRSRPAWSCRRSGHRQDRGRSASRRVPPVRAPRAPGAGRRAGGGPEPGVPAYISQVLPSLGETSATQTTVDGLLGLRFRVVAEDRGGGRDQGRRCG